MGKVKCEKCGHIGFPELIHDDEKCEKCFSRYVYSIEAEKIEAEKKECSSGFFNKNIKKETNHKKG